MSPHLHIAWPYLLLASLLLCLPRQWLRVGRVFAPARRAPKNALEKFSSGPAQDPSDRSLSLGKELRSKRNYIDILRAAAGGYCLRYFTFVATDDRAKMQMLFIQGVLLLVAILIQSIRFEGRFGFFAPCFYYIGLSTGYMSYIVGPFAMLLLFAINPIIPNPRMFVATYGLLLLPLGWLLAEKMEQVNLMTSLVLLPPVLSLMTRRPMVIYAKKIKHN